MDAASTRTLGGWNAVKGQAANLHMRRARHGLRGTENKKLKKKRRKKSCFRTLVLFISLFEDKFSAKFRLPYKVQCKKR